MSLIIGNEYLVTHSRKGKFTARVKSVDDEWVTLEVTAGKVGAMCNYNEAGVGEEVTVRLSFCQFTPEGET